MIVEIQFFAEERPDENGLGRTGRVFKAPQQLHVEPTATGAFFTGLGYVMAKDVEVIGPPQSKPARLPDGTQTRLRL